MPTFQESIDRLKSNEERLDDFVNELGSYLTMLGVPVETIRSFLARKETEIDEQLIYALRVYLESQVKNPVSSAGILSDNSFPTNAKRELGVIFSGQNPNGGMPKTLPVMAQTIFQPAQEIMTEFVHYRTDLLPGSTLYRAIPLVSLKSFGFNSPIDLKLFSPTKTIDGAITEFKCNADYPIHTVLNGSMSILVRVGATTDPKFNLRIALRPADGLPRIELGNAAGRQDLGISLASLDQTPADLIASEFRDFTDGSNTPLDGKWVRKTINVCQDVVFYPNASYNFTLRLVNVDGTVDQKNYGFRYESGGLSMLFDATSAWKSIAEQNVNL